MLNPDKPVDDPDKPVISLKNPDEDDEDDWLENEARRVLKDIQQANPEVIYPVNQRFRRKTSRRKSSLTGKKGDAVALFLATHINKLDKKGRTFVPAVWRASLISPEFSGIILIPSTKNACLDGFNLARMQQLAGALDEFDFYSPEHIAGATTFFGEAQQVAFDSEGRIVLPDNLIAHAKLSDGVAFVGLGQFFQLWDPTALAAHQEAQREYMKNHRLSLKLGGQP